MYKVLLPVLFSIISANFCSNKCTIDNKLASILHQESGKGTYYYDSNSNTCIEDEVFPEGNGITACESYTPGPNQKTILERNTNYIVAINNDLLQEDNGREKYCGKRVLVKYNGISVDKTFFVWDGCQACRFDSIIDFSLSALLDIESNTCFLGIVPGIYWTIIDEQVLEFVP